MLRARMDVERIAKLVEAQGVQVFPQDYWTPLP